MLDNMVHMDGLAAGRSLRDRKPVTYTFGKSFFSPGEHVASSINISFMFSIPLYRFL